MNPENKKQLSVLRDMLADIWTTPSNVMRKAKVEALLIRLEGWAKEVLGDKEGSVFRE